MAIMFENVNGMATLNGGAALAKIKANGKRDGYKPFLSQKVDFFRYEDPENHTRRLGVALHESVDTRRAGKFEFPLEQGECARAADYLECSTEVPNRFWDTQTWTQVDRTWQKGDRKIYTLGFCNLLDTTGRPDKPIRVCHMKGLFLTTLTSGKTGLVRVMRIRQMHPTYATLVVMISAWRAH